MIIHQCLSFAHCLVKDSKKIKEVTFANLFSLSCQRKVCLVNSELLKLSEECANILLVMRQA